MDEHEEIRKEAIEHAHEESPRRRGTAMKIGALVLITFTILYFYSGHIIGMIASTKVKDNTLEQEGITIRFEGQTLQELQEHYVENEHREIKACLIGKIDGKEYRVKEIYFPEVIDSSVIHIRTGICPLKTIIDLHSHPINKCIASETDLRYFSRFKKSKPALLMMIMCAKERFNLYQNK